MTTFKHPRGKTFRYDFRWTPPGASIAQRYIGSTGQLTKVDADAVEAKIKLRVRQQWADIAPADRMQTPSFTAWAEIHVDHVEKRGKVSDLAQLEGSLRHVLMFFGRRPTSPPVLPARVPQALRAAILARHAAAPYHDLRLIDPILDPSWIERFEDWMRDLGLSGARKNHLRSAASGLYRTALKPAFRKQAHVERNPFLHIDRDQVITRDRTLTPRQLWAWITAAPPHTRIAMAIAAYCPKLREGVILDLEWDTHLDRALTQITVQRHKARRFKNRAQVALIPDDLRAILQWLRKAQPTDRFVVTMNGEPVGTLRKGLEAAVARANLTLPADEQIVYGMKVGVTFHTIRHSMATFLAELGVPDKLREAVMDQTAQTIQGYTHLRPRHERAPVDTLAGHLQLVEAVQRVQGKVQEPTSQTSEFPKKIVGRRKGGTRPKIAASR